jgi:hypothetical protein
MRHLRFGVLALFVCVLAVAGGAAYAAKPKQAVFEVTLTATLTKQWTFTRIDSEEECTRTTRGSGRWQAKVSTRRAARIRAVAAAGGRVRFSSSVLTALAGSATRSGSMSTAATGPPPCERFSRSARCDRERRSFRSGSISLGSPRRGVLRLGRLRGAEGIRTFRSACLEEPGDIRTIRTDLPLASGPLDRSDVFDPRVRRWFVTGDTDQVTTIEGNIDGRVTERVQWRVNFTRLRG